MKPSGSTAERLRSEMLQFRDGYDSIHLATASAQGEPEASAVPAVIDAQGRFYILISGLARHTQNLCDNPYASVLLIEPAGTAENPFARHRLSYQCRAGIVDRDSASYSTLLDAFEAKFGDIVTTLRALPDFSLWCLQPTAGRYVRGFGQAWQLSGSALDQLDHINPGRDRESGGG